MSVNLTGNSIRPVIFYSGAPPFSTNRGVGALSAAGLDQLNQRFPESRLIVAGSGSALRQSIRLSDRLIEIETSWLTGSPKLQHRSGARHLKWLCTLRGVLPWMGTRWFSNRALVQLLDSAAFLDISGGDSFSDIYGIKLFREQIAVKRLPLRLGKPLVLLPQTVGPFKSELARTLAKEVIQGASVVATREVGGLRELEQLLETDLDNRFIECPDIAFVLRPRSVDVPSIIDVVQNDRLFGLNVSGLLWAARSHFGSNSDYHELTHRIMEWVLQDTDCRLLLVPHVFNERPTAASISKSNADVVEDSDLEIAKDLHSKLVRSYGDRVLIVDQPYDASQLKWIIGHCDFFVGARMHACIGAVSQCVPTATLAYSKKAAGVMGMMNPSPPVVDLRGENLDSVISKIREAFHNRDEIRQSLRQTVPGVQARVQEFFQTTLPLKLGLAEKLTA